jgi:hypothetical protein
MIKETLQWQFRNGTNAPTEFTTFPFAFRSMYNLVRQGIENKKPLDTSNFLILGPKNPRGERVQYKYNAAVEFAQSMGLLSADGHINGKEFKSKKI